MQEKLAITVLVITLALFALVYVLYTIVRDRQADSYNQTILGQQDYDSRVIPYRRGDIVDRNGTYLATSDKVYNLIIDPHPDHGQARGHLRAHHRGSGDARSATTARSSEGSDHRKSRSPRTSATRDS